MKTTAHLLSGLREYARPIGQFLSGSLVLAALQAQAVTCEFANLFNENLTFPVVGPGISTVGEDVPVGKVLYASRFMSKGYSTGYACTVTDMEQPMMNAFNRVEVIATPSGAPTRSGGKDIFPTNVPGIGAIFYISGSLYKNAAFLGFGKERLKLVGER